MKADFLERLVARSFGAAEGVRPRPAALFEPAQPIGGLPLVSDGEAEDDGAPEPSPLRRPAAEPRSATPVGSEVASSPARSSYLGEPGPPAPRTSEQAATDPAQARPDRGEAPPAPRRRAPAALAPRQRDLGRPEVTERPRVERVAREVVVERRPEPAGRRAPPPPSPAAPGRPAASEPAVREVVVERIAEVARPRQATLLPPATAPPPGHPSGERGERTGRENRLPPAPPYRPGPPAPVVIQPRVERHRGRDDPAVAAPAATPPAVYVTIGRVEVRAVPAPAEPAERSRPRPKVMSLDEYLEQRSDGGRR